MSSECQEFGQLDELRKKYQGATKLIRRSLTTIVLRMSFPATHFATPSSESACFFTASSESPRSASNVALVFPFICTAITTPSVCAFASSNVGHSPSCTDFSPPVLLHNSSVICGANGESIFKK